MTFTIMTLSLTIQNVPHNIMLSVADAENNIRALHAVSCRYSECRYAERRGANIWASTKTLYHYIIQWNSKQEC
jgi:hypothetical protein